MLELCARAVRIPDRVRRGMHRRRRDRPRRHGAAAGQPGVGPSAATRFCSEPSAVPSGTIRRVDGASRAGVARACAAASSCSRTSDRSSCIRACIDVGAPEGAMLLRGVDILFVRELTGGVYFGQPSERRVGVDGREAVDTVVYSEQRGGPRRAPGVRPWRSRAARRVTSVDKANILATSRLWREVDSRGRA